MFKKKDLDDPTNVDGGFDEEADAAFLAACRDLVRHNGHSTLGSSPTFTGDEGKHAAPGSGPVAPALDRDAAPNLQLAAIRRKLQDSEEQAIELAAHNEELRQAVAELTSRGVALQDQLHTARRDATEASRNVVPGLKAEIAALHEQVTAARDEADQLRAQLGTMGALEKQVAKAKGSADTARAEAEAKIAQYEAEFKQAQEEAETKFLQAQQEADAKLAQAQQEAQASLKSLRDEAAGEIERLNAEIERLGGEVAEARAAAAAAKAEAADPNLLDDLKFQLAEREREVAELTAHAIAAEERHALEVSEIVSMLTNVSTD